MNTISKDYKEFVDTEYTKFRKNLLRVKGSDRQRQFLYSVRNNDSFLEDIGIVDSEGLVEPPILASPLTEDEYWDPPVDTEQELYERWSAVSPAMACRSRFWAAVTVDHVRMGRIQSSYLASGGSYSSGAERIDTVLSDKTKKTKKNVDYCVRTVLRQLGGLPEVRGNRSVFVDCPFARSWWRERMIRQATEECVDMEANLRIILRRNKIYWEKFIDRIVFRNSTFGAKNIRGAFLRSLSQAVLDGTAADGTSTKGLQRLCRRVMSHQGSRELSILDDRELESLMSDVVLAS